MGDLETCTAMSDKDNIDKSQAATLSIWYLTHEL